MQGRRGIQRRGLTPSRASREGFPEAGMSSWTSVIITAAAVQGDPLCTAFWLTSCPALARITDKETETLADKETETRRGESLSGGCGVCGHPTCQTPNTSSLPPGWQMLMRPLRAGRDTRSVKTGWSSAHRPRREDVLGRELFCVLPIL